MPPPNFSGLDDPPIKHKRTFVNRRKCKRMNGAIEVNGMDEPVEPSLCIHCICFMPPLAMFMRTEKQMPEFGELFALAAVFCAGLILVPAADCKCIIIIIIINVYEPNEGLAIEALDMETKNEQKWSESGREKAGQRNEAGRQTVRVGVSCGLLFPFLPPTLDRPPIRYSRQGRDNSVAEA
ncbi:hypothetical protein GPALN_005566 [Globodera pallida]|nr:hypothetical protein GPALN_005566 [Globodera pallida]